jgi:hypothetical protein
VSRRVVVAGVLIGPYLGVKIAPGFARSLKEADATADVLIAPRREAAKNATTREAGGAA